MKKVLSAGVVILLALGLPATHAATKVAAGQKCAKVNQKITVGAKVLICTKSGKKLAWKAAPVVSSIPSPQPFPSTTPVPATNASLPGLWGKYNWSKMSASDISAASLDAFTKYVSVKRSPNQEVKVLSQDGSDATLVTWIKNGATLVATTFEYPKLSGPFYDVVALDSSWLADAYKSAGFSDNEVKDRVGGFNAGAPAFGGTRTNTWNSKTIVQDNLMVRDKVGMAQTAGHEFFHAIQENYAKRNPGPNGESIPNWFWEGPATFVGVYSAANLGEITLTEGDQAFIDRYNNGAAINRTSNLIDIKANDGKVDPYALGFAGTQLLVANVGIEKFLRIYAELGAGKSFEDAFASATGVQLGDFYSMFEEVRGSLGFAKQ